ncbi:MAG: translocation/assembly module TamB domain-containing protein [Sphingobium sp.]|nr:translocation/assembly module TamB domain-containing protein [Sphingobium sp.]
MAEPEEVLPDKPVTQRVRRRWSRISLGFLILLALVAALAVGALRWLDSESGHSFVLSRIAGLEPASGLRIRVGSIEGSIYSKARLRDVQLLDPEGEFARISVADLQWYPLAWFADRLDVDRLHVGPAELKRLPRFRPTGAQKSILPSFDIRLMDLRVDRLALGASVTGQPHVVRGAGRIDIRSGRAVVNISAHALDGADTIRLALDSRPDDGRFDIDGVATAPQGGVIAGLAGLAEPMAMAIKGDGNWKRWRGRFVVMRQSGTLANIAIEARDGRYMLHGPLARIGPLSALGTGMAMLDGDVRFENKIVSGKAGLSVPGLAVTAEGGVDLVQSRYDNLLVNAQAADLSRVSSNLSGRDAALKARLSGPFATAGLEFLVTLRELKQGGFTIAGLKLDGAGKMGGSGGAWPIKLTTQSVRSGNPQFDPLLRGLKAQGLVRLAGGTLWLDRTQLRASGVSGELHGQFRPSDGNVDFTLAAVSNGFEFNGLGRVDLDAMLRVARPPKRALAVSGTARAQVRRLDNGFLSSIGGGLPTVTSGLSFGADGRLDLRNLKLVAPALSLTGEGYRSREGLFHIAGSGAHRDYGPLALVLDGHIERPRVDLTLRRPGQGMQLADVHAKLEPSAAGYDFVGNGQSMLGPFAVDGAILLPANGQVQIDFDAIRVADVVAKGTLTPVTGGIGGKLDLSGPATGSITLAVTDGVQHLGLDVDLGNANFAGPLRLTVNRGRVQADIALKEGAVGLNGQIQARGVRYGSLRIGRLSGSARLVNGEGTAAVSATADNGRAFNITARSNISSGRISTALTGTVERETIRLQGPVILSREGDGWRLQPVRLSLRNGGMQLGAFFGAESTHVDASLSRIPLSLLDLVNSELGLGGTADGTLVYDAPRGGVPSGALNLRVRGLTRSGLALSSAPIDIGINGVLDPRRAAMRAVISEGGAVTGRAQALLTPLGEGSLMDRLNAAPLQADIRYNGSADTLWRLTNIELLSFGGRVGISAQARGTLADPDIRGSVSTTDASLQSPVTGMTLSHVSATGAFDGASLRLDNLSGQTPGGGKVAGAATFSFSSERGIGMDVQLQATRAVLLDRDDIGATVSGPLRIRSTGGAGTISGNLDIVESRFMLGRAAAVAEIPQIRLIEINRQGDEVTPARAVEPWRLDITAKANCCLHVEGLGMTSEWAADLQIGGTVTNPSIKGTATLVDGTYDFAGKRFDLREGRLTFTGSVPVNPVLDIRAVADVSDLNATISVTGTSLRPIISMSSIPAMPQDELLSRLLFGTSITKLSAPEAIQLASAVAAFQGEGGGLDPINAIRKATGLSRLRILPADATTGARTSIAAGKNIGRLYVELITDGQGYSATRVEFQITRWLSLLSTVSTIGRQNVGARISKDY